MKKIVVITVLAFCFLVFGCDLFLEDNAIIGTWRWESGASWDNVTFNRDGTFAVVGQNAFGIHAFEGTYTITSETLTMHPYDNDYNNDTMINSYLVSGDTLVMSDDYGSWAYQRQ